MTVKEQELYVAINRLTFCLVDEDGNEVLNKDGTIKEFYFKGRLKPLEYLCEDMTVEDLEEVLNEI
jgi:hypothetical protein